MDKQKVLDNESLILLAQSDIEHILRLTEDILEYFRYMEHYSAPLSVKMNAIVNQAKHVENILKGIEPV